MSIIWDDINEWHNIEPKGAFRIKLDKYIDGGQLPNKNVTAAQAEAVIKSQIDALIAIDGVHLYIHIFTFPNKDEPDVPFNYVLWLAETGMEPSANWWEVGQ